MPMTNIAEAVDRMTKAGYVEDFRAEAAGLRATRSGALYEPEDLVIDELVRVEGPSDPADEAIVLALRTRDGKVRGTWTTAYGPTAHPFDSGLMPRLEHAHPTI